MEAVFTILVIAVALLSVVGVMFMILREKVDHDAPLHYVRSPWTDDAVETQNAVDAQFQKHETAGANTVEVAEPDAGASEQVVVEEDADDKQA